MLRLTSGVETRLEVKSETLVSAQEDPFSGTTYDEGFPSFHCRREPSLTYRISRMRIALRQSFASNFCSI